MSNTSLKSILQQHKDKLIKTGATGLIGLMVANSFVACDQIILPNYTVESTSDVTEHMSGNDVSEYETEFVTGAETVTDAETGTSSQTEQRKHSDLYWETKNQWADLWNKKYGEMTDKEQFQIKGAPFAFLAQQGAVYYDDYGNAYAYGNEDFENNNCIQSHVYVDEHSIENDIYVLTQYVSAPVSDLYSDNNGAYVATYMLKYNLPNDVYKDFLLYTGDLRCGMLVSKISEKFKPEIISQSVVEFDLIQQLRLFDKGLVFDWLGEYINYIENIDYENLNLTITYKPGKDKHGQFCTYTFNLKETPMWERCIRSLENDGVYFPITKEERDAHANSELMPTRETDVGDALCGFYIDGRMICAPSEEQKATTEHKWSFASVGIRTQGRNDAIDKYERGEINYSKVNGLTENYAKTEGYTSGN